MPIFNLVKEALLHLAFPHVCEGCGSDIVESKKLLCLRCLSVLPQTNFHLHPGNPIEKIFWGRLAVTHATASYYFTKESLIQRLMHEFKYHGNKELGFFLGVLMGNLLVMSNRFSFLDALIPLPLFLMKERKRGFNQAEILCNGIASILQIPVMNQLVHRTMHTESQTKKGRMERWQNIEGRFAVNECKQLKGKHVLLVDDVITTGATLEACGRVLLQKENCKLSVATLCFSSGF